MKGKVFILFFFVNVILFAQQPKLVLPVGHTGDVTGVQISQNGKMILTASTDNTAKIWDASTGILLADLKGHTDYVTDAQFSPDSKKVITASRDNSLKIWDVASGSILFDLKDHKDYINSVRFSPDGSKIVTASWDKTCKIWNVFTGSLLKQLNGHTNWVLTANFSSDGKKIVTSSVDSTIMIWDAAEGNLIFTVKFDYKCNSADFSPDGNRILTTTLDGKMKILDASTGLLFQGFKQSDYSVNTAQFSQDGTKIAISLWDSTAKILDAYNGALLADLKGHPYRKVEFAEFSPNGNYVVTASDNILKLWDTKTGTLLYNLTGHDFQVNSAKFSPSGKRIVTAALDYTAKSWDVLSGKLEFEMSGYSQSINSVSFHKDCKKIVLVNENNDTKFIDLNTGAYKNYNFDYNDTSILIDSSVEIRLNYRKDVLIMTYKSGRIQTKNLFSNEQKNKHTRPITSAKLSPDRKRIVTASEDGTVKIWDINSGNLLIDLAEKTYSASFSPDGKYILTEGDGNTINIWDASSGNRVSRLKGHKNQIIKCTFSPDGKKIATTSFDNTVKIWNVFTGKKLVDIIGHSGAVQFACFSPDGKQILSSSFDNTARIWDVLSGKMLTNLIGHTGYVKWAGFSPDGKKIFTGSTDNTIKIWDAKTHQLLFTTFDIGNNDYFTQVPAGYYQCTPAAAKLLHYVTNDLKVITFEQLDVKYNRPDLVLKAIGSNDTNLIKSYKKAYEKRIKKLGIDTTAFRVGYSVPEIDFVNRNEIEYEQINNQLTIHIKGADSVYKLDRFNVWVNEIPVYGQKGINIHSRKTYNIDTSLVIELSAGENRLETSILNVSGTESYRMPLYVKYTPEKTLPQKVHFIGLAMEKFKDSSYNLRYSAKDIRDLAKEFEEKYGNEIEIDTIFNENISAKNIQKIKQKLLKTNVNDKVIVAYSGHGLLSKDLDYYLSTYTVDFENPEKNGLPYETLENLLDSIPARQKLMLIDACHSGEVDKEEHRQIENIADSLGLSKGAKVKNTKAASTKHLGLENSFELMQNLFVNVSKGTGATVISASGGTQFALERGSLKNGVFTYSILEAMNNYTSMTVSQLKTTVGNRVVELTGGMQKPTSRSETLNNDWRVW